MKKYSRNIAILIFPFLLLGIINEITRLSITKKPNSSNEVATINSNIEKKDKCTWACHNNTKFCKENHVKLLKKSLKHTDTIYFGLINLLKTTGNYQVANIILLVIIIPLTIWFLLVKSLNAQVKINKLKNRKNGITGI